MFVLVMLSLPLQARFRCLLRELCRSGAKAEPDLVVRTAWLSIGNALRAEHIEGWV